MKCWCSFSWVLCMWAQKTWWLLSLNSFSDREWLLWEIGQTATAITWTVALPVGSQWETHRENHRNRQSMRLLRNLGAESDPAEPPLPSWRSGATLPSPCDSVALSVSAPRGSHCCSLGRAPVRYNQAHDQRAQVSEENSYLKNTDSPKVNSRFFMRRLSIWNWISLQDVVFKKKLSFI